MSYNIYGDLKPFQVGKPVQRLHFTKSWYHLHQKNDGTTAALIRRQTITPLAPEDTQFFFDILKQRNGQLSIVNDQLSTGKN